MITSTIRPGVVEGVWMSHGEGDVHVHTEAGSLVIGSNSNRGQSRPDTAIIVDGSGAHIQLCDSGKVTNMPLPTGVLSGWLAALVAHAKGYAAARAASEADAVPLDFSVDTNQVP